MNTKSPTPSRDFFRNLMGRATALLLAACLGIMAPLSIAKAESIDALHGLSPMNAAELEEAYGGYILPNGMNINIGIETEILLDGKSVVHNYYSSGKITAPTSASSTVAAAKIEQLGTTTKVYPVASSASVSQPETQTTTLPTGNTTITSSADPLTGNVTTLVSNSANGAVISQIQSITIDITNYVAEKSQAYQALTALKSQAMNSLRNVLRR
ncbi:MAG: hypothetical protein ABTQ34_01650 [Bdellovibrionales bacterium]